MPHTKPSVTMHSLLQPDDLCLDGEPPVTNHCKCFFLHGCHTPEEQHAIRCQRRQWKLEQVCCSHAGILFGGTPGISRQMIIKEPWAVRDEHLKHGVSIHVLITMFDRLCRS